MTNEFLEDYLKDYLDQNDPTKKVEDNPAPKRTLLNATKVAKTLS